MRRLLVSAVVAFTILAPLTSSAQDVEPGAHDFAIHCAICHGPVGKGDGMVGELFRTPPRDLTSLSKENGGTFPFERVFRSIDGSERIAAHGVGNPMPIWGDFLQQEVHEEAGLPPGDATAVAQARILALTYYIQSLQQ